MTAILPRTGDARIAEKRRRETTEQLRREIDSKREAEIGAVLVSAVEEYLRKEFGNG